MGLLGSLLATHNIPFLLALGSAFIFALLQIVSAGSDTAADPDTDADVDADADTDVDAHPHIDTDGSIMGAMLGILGLGRVPLTFILMAFLGSFGAVGLIGNALLVNARGRYPDPAFLPMLLVSTALALLITNRVSHLLGRLVPNTSTAIRIEQLVGRVGLVVSPSVSPTYGRVQVRDPFGSLHTVYAVIAEGDPLPDQSEVALLAYDATRRCFIVKAMR